MFSLEVFLLQGEIASDTISYNSDLELKVMKTLCNEVPSHTIFLGKLELLTVKSFFFPPMIFENVLRCISQQVQYLKLNSLNLICIMSAPSHSPGANTSQWA